MDCETWRPPEARWSVAAPPALAVSLAPLKEELRITGSAEDAGLTRRMETAIAQVEAETGRLLTRRAVMLSLPGFPPTAATPIDLPGGVIGDVASVVYVDGDGATQTLAADSYAVETYSRAPGRLRLGHGLSWPAVRPHGLPVKITYDAGYAPAGSPATYEAAIPSPLQSAVIALALEAHVRRRPVGRSDMVPAAYGYASLVAKWRLRWIA